MGNSNFGGIGAPETWPDNPAVELETTIFITDDLYEDFGEKLDDWDDVLDGNLERLPDAILEFYRKHWAEMRPTI